MGNTSTLPLSLSLQFFSPSSTIWEKCWIVFCCSYLMGRISLHCPSHAGTFSSLTHQLGFTIVFFMQEDNHHTTLSCSLSHIGFFLVFTHTASWEPCSITHDFPVKGHSHFSVVWCFPYRFVACVYVFPMPSWEPGFPLPSSDCVIFPGGFIVENGLLFSHVGWLCLPLHFGAVVGCFGVILATIGPRTSQELFSLSKLWIACLTVCMQWLVFELCWNQGWGLSFLDKLGVFGNHTDRARGMAFSTTLE